MQIIQRFRSWNYLRKLPTRLWSEEETNTVYQNLTLVPTGKMHDSGYMIIAVVGKKLSGKEEICGQCSDDLSWIIPNMKNHNETMVPRIRIDCLFPEGFIHIWSNHYYFKVDYPLSSTDIKLVDSDEYKEISDVYKKIKEKYETINKRING